MKLMKYLLAGFVLAVAWPKGGSLLQRVPSESASRINPLESNERNQRAGAKLYAQECAACHGENRQGRRGIPPLIRPEVSQASPGALFWVLRNGSLHTGMPSFAHLPEAERWQIVTWLQHGTGTGVFGTSAAPAVSNRE